MHKNIVAQIRKATRKKYSAEEKIRIVLEGLRGEIDLPPLRSVREVLMRFRSIRGGGGSGSKQS